MMVDVDDGDPPLDLAVPSPALPPPSYDPANVNQVLDEFNGDGGISPTNKVQTSSARKLVIHDISYKLQISDTYDIGGTYSLADSNTNAPERLELVPELWFFFTTTACPGHNYLLNLFVCHRKTGNFAIAINRWHKHYDKEGNNEKHGHIPLLDAWAWNTFKSSQPNENFYIKSINFTEEDIRSLDSKKSINIPISINMKGISPLKNEVIKRIKLNHDFGNLLAKQEKTDFVLTSMSGKEYPVHKIFLVAHSPVLKDIIKDKSSHKQNNHTFLDLADNEMELLLQFIYTGTIKEIRKHNCLKLLQIADRFQLKQLFALTQHAISYQIDVNNAIDIACLSKEFKLEKLQKIVFNFIKSNPKVLESDGWKNLDDVHLAKKLFQYLQTGTD